MAAVNRNMCSLMSNYCCLLCPCQARKKMTILILGLDNAGKTTLVKGLQKESTCDIAPTVGFSRADLHIDRFDVTMFDLGGSPNIRAIWQNYYADAHGAVFVVDSSDQSRIAEARDAVTGILMHPQIAGKPVLVLANKQDNERALCEADIIEHLSLEQLVNKNKCLCKIEKCSAVQMKGPKGEYCGLTSLRWLLAAINGDHAKLHQRVLQDSAEQKQHQEAERKERYERVRLARLQREQVKGAEDLQHASFEQEEKDATNPFQPIKTVLTKNKARMLRQQQESVSTQTQQTKGENGGPSENNADEITEPNNQRIQQMPSPGKRFSGESHEGVDAETQKSKKSKRKTRKIKLNRVEPLDADGVN